ncbi:MAG: amidase [Nitrososphaeraceae archaeon]
MFEKINLDLPIMYLAPEIKSGRLSPTDLTKYCLNRIEKFNPYLKAFITVEKECALEDAYCVEKKIKKGNYLGPLHGIPFSIKDNISAKGIRSTRGSQIFSNNISPVDSTVVKKLKKAGAILLGTNNMNEFASGIDGKNIFYGNTKNPWDSTRISGGSSSGSAVAVKTGMAIFSVGTDTGGSVRVPASLCGVVGFKPTYGIISTQGIFGLAPSLDHVGIISRSSLDCIMIFNILRNKKFIQKNKNNLPQFSPIYQNGEYNFLKKKPIFLGIPKKYFTEFLQSEVKRVFNNFIKESDSSSVEICEVDVNETDNSFYESWKTIRLYESSRIHAKLMNDFLMSYSPEVRNMLLKGQVISRKKYYQSLKKVSKIRRYFLNFFNKLDFLITPTTAISAPKMDNNTVRIENKNIQVRDALLRNTFLFNSLGFPALSLPLDFNRYTKMPIGLQLIGKPLDDINVLFFGDYIEEKYKLANRFKSIPPMLLN